MKLGQVILMLFIFNYMEANQTFEIDTKQIKEMIKTNSLYIINVDEKSKWNNKKVKVKNFQTIGKRLVIYNGLELDFNNYKKDTVFIISSKNDSTSIEFVNKLTTFGFQNIKYLINGNESLNEILINYKGLKLFSMFNN